MTVVKKEITISAGDVHLKGNLVVPAHPKAIIIFSHGSGSSRFSPRNNLVANVLNSNGFATLLTDLLTLEEDRIYENRFDISLLSKRLIEVTQRVTQLKELNHLPIGYFGASTGAASALNAAAALPELIGAVVSRGGRPDMAYDALPLVKAPVLLLVGGLDAPVIELNKRAMDQMHCRKKMVIVNGATHLFEETGKLREVAQKACSWFDRYLIKVSKNVSEDAV